MSESFVLYSRTFQFQGEEATKEHPLRNFSMKEHQICWRHSFVQQPENQTPSVALWNLLLGFLRDAHISGNVSD